MNKVFFIGNLVRDPEPSNTSSGVAVCKMSIAVNRNFTNAQGERECDFINIVAWRGLAENCSKYLSKGKKIAVAGSLQIRSYEYEGQKRIAAEVMADEVEFLSPVDKDTETSAPTAKKKVSELTPVDDGDLPF